MAKRAGAIFTFSEYLNARVDDLRRLISKALKWESDAIRQARATTRRLKAAIDLLDPVLTSGDWRPFTKTLKRLRKRLGPLRDLDVMLEHMEPLMGRRSCADGAGWLIRC